MKLHITMARHLDNHNRSDDKSSTDLSRFEEMNLERRLVEREQHRVGWLRNFAILAALIVVALLANLLAR